MKVHFLLLACVVSLLLGRAEVEAADPFELPRGPGRQLVYGKCRTCHDLQYLVDSAGVDAATWDGLLDDMEGYGCEFDATERERLLAYLSTFLGPTPPPASAAGAVTPSKADGASLFREQCASCHQENGRGVPGDFPPLDGNPDLFADRLLPVYVLLFGLEGEITVNGNRFDGVMPAFSHLSDAEIAALVNHIRSNWSNRVRFEPAFTIRASEVADLREPALGPGDVQAYRRLRLAR